MTKATINGIDVVLAENVREALEWDTMQHMLYGLKDGKEVLKVRVSDLKSAGWDFTKFGKVKRNTLYVYFLTRQGVARHVQQRSHWHHPDDNLGDCKIDPCFLWIVKWRKSLIINTCALFVPTFRLYRFYIYREKQKSLPYLIVRPWWTDNNNNNKRRTKNEGRKQQEAREHED